MKDSNTRRTATSERPWERIVLVEACNSSLIDFDSSGQSSIPLAQGVAQSGLIRRIGPLNSGYTQLATTGSRVADAYVGR